MSYLNIKTGKEATEMELLFAGQQLLNQRLNKGAPVIDSPLKVASFMAMKSTINGETWALYLTESNVLIKPLQFNGSKELLTGAVYSGAKKVVIVKVEKMIQPSANDKVWVELSKALSYLQVNLDDYIKVRSDENTQNFSFKENNLL